MSVRLCGYGTLIARVEQLGLNDTVPHLGATLVMAAANDRKLTHLAQI